MGVHRFLGWDYLKDTYTLVHRYIVGFQSPADSLSLNSNFVNGEMYIGKQKVFIGAYH